MNTNLNTTSNSGFNFDNSYLNLPKSFFTRLAPSPVSSPEIVIVNDDLATSMGLTLSELSTQEQASLLSGNTLPQDAEPFSQAYAGHQFGHFTILGDGRAHILGEHSMPNGQRVDIQFKGSGRTPYSRNGDGRAVLGPMLREYIISEAMHALGIPSTRSLAVVSTGESVLRETVLPGAILTRVASSHIRVGTFEYAAIQEDKNLLQALLDYSIDRHFPEIKGNSNIALSFLKTMMQRQADLIVEWMRIGFIHGVMNTDNMTISGESIDYGPCAFMNHFDPETVFSSIDHMGRYAYGNQPVMAQWNLSRLAGALLPLLAKDQNEAIQLAQKTIHEFPELYKDKWMSMMRCKLGLFGDSSDDEQLISSLLNWMKENKADYTNTFRALSKTEKPSEKLFDTPEFNHWYKDWQSRLEKNPKSDTSSLEIMQKNNPVVIPRNHIVEEALSSATEGNLKPFQDLLHILKTPYKDSDHLAPYQSPPEPSNHVYRTFCGT